MTGAFLDMPLGQRPDECNNQWWYTYRRQIMEDQALSNEQLVRLLLDRLEHISADSVLAHKASGVRGALIRCIETGESVRNNHLHSLLEHGFSILEAAAKERSK